MLVKWQQKWTVHHSVSATYTRSFLAMIEAKWEGDVAQAVTLSPILAQSGISQKLLYGCFDIWGRHLSQPQNKLE